MELARARANRPRDAEASLLAGQCMIRLQRYQDAVGALEVVRAVSPDLEGVDVSLAIARYHLEDLAGARAALARAEARNPDRASVQLYRGLLLLADSDNQGGVDALERARQLDPGYAEPVSSFYQGLAYAAIDDADGARQALSRVVSEWPDTAWSEEARNALERMEEASQRSRWWVTASIGAEYDTNVLLRGSGVDLPEDISDEKDWRGAWTAAGGVTLFETRDWAGGVLASYYGTRQDETTEFDTHYPTVSAWLDHAFAETTIARVQYRFGFAWVDYDAYLEEHAWEAALLQGFDEWGTSRLFLGYLRNDFRFENEDVVEACVMGQPCGPPGLDEKSERNRDGWEISTGLEHVVPLPDGLGLRKTSVRGGYQFSWYDANGREYSHQEHAFELTADTTGPLELELAADVTYAYRPYRHASTFPDPPIFFGVPYTLDQDDREEHEWRVGASIARAVSEHLKLALSWRYTNNDSNVRVFDYDRHVVGLHLTGSLGQ